MRTPADQEPGVHRVPLSSDAKVRYDAKEIEPRMLLNSALQGPQNPVLCFQPFGIHLLQIILEEQLRSKMMLPGDKTCVTPLMMAIPHDMPPCWTDRRRDPSCSWPCQQCCNPASHRFPCGSAPLLPAGVWKKTGLGLQRLHRAARSQRGGTSYRRMPRMPKGAAPMAWVTAL